MNRQEKVEAFDIYLAKHKGCLTPEQENRYIDLIVEARSNHSEEEGQEQEEPLPLELVKLHKILELRVRDNSAEVNGFKIGGQVMWINKYDRANLKNAVTDLQDSGEETVKFKGVTLPVAQAKTMLSAIEVYAAKCAEKTDAHEAAILEMGSEDDVERYDITVGYPEMLEF